jgi:hypothetical protein
MEATVLPCEGTVALPVAIVERDAGYVVEICAAAGVSLLLTGADGTDADQA